MFWLYFDFGQTTFKNVPRNFRMTLIFDSSVHIGSETSEKSGSEYETLLQSIMTSSVLDRLDVKKRTEILADPEPVTVALGATALLRNTKTLILSISS